MIAMCGCTAFVAHSLWCFRFPAVTAAARHKCSDRHTVVCSRSHTAITSMLHLYPTLGMQMLLCAFARHLSSRRCVSHVRNSHHWLYSAAILASAVLEACRPSYMFSIRHRSTLKLPRSSSPACLRLLVAHKSRTMACMPGARVLNNSLASRHVTVAGEDCAFVVHARMLWV